jgi:hypothetical protein
MCCKLQQRQQNPSGCVTNYNSGSRIHQNVSQIIRAAAESIRMCHKLQQRQQNPSELQITTAAAESIRTCRKLQQRQQNPPECVTNYKSSSRIHQNVSQITTAAAESNIIKL